MAKDERLIQSPDVVGARKRSRFDVAVLIALLPVVAAAVRIWMYSGGDSALFLVLLRTLNIPAVLIGTGILMVPSLLTLALIILLTDKKAREWVKKLSSNHRWLFTIVIPIFLVIVGYTISWTTFVWLTAIALVALVFFFIQRRWRKFRQRKTGVEAAQRRSPIGPDSFATLFTVVAVFLVTPTNMWLPLEQVSIAGGGARVGYVLESAAEWTTILTNDRKLEIVATPKVESRAICNVPNPGTLAMLIQHGSVKGGPDCT